MTREELNSRAERITRAAIAEAWRYSTPTVTPIGDAPSAHAPRPTSMTDGAVVLARRIGTIGDVAPRHS